MAARVHLITPGEGRTSKTMSCQGAMRYTSTFLTGPVITTPGGGGGGGGLFVLTPPAPTFAVSCTGFQI